MVPRLLVIAGSDSSGGAGIQADIKTAQAFGVYAQTAITAVTVQNTLGVTDTHIVPPAIVREQIIAWGAVEPQSRLILVPSGVTPMATISAPSSHNTSGATL